jgi:hypothetical protein
MCEINFKPVKVFPKTTFNFNEPHLDISAYTQATQGSLDEAMVTTKVDESESLKMKTHSRK